MIDHHIWSIELVLLSNEMSNELLDNNGSDIETCGELYNEMESNKKSNLAVHSQGRQSMDVPGSS